MIQTTSATPVATITRGFDRVVRSLTSSVKTAHLDAGEEAAWNSRYVADSPLTDKQQSMADFGYRDFEVSDRADTTIAMAGPNQVLTEEGVHELRNICDKLADDAVDNDYVVSRRIRNVEVASQFVHDMMRDPHMLLRLSAIAGTPLVPHPLRAAATQTNYYNSRDHGKSNDEQVAKWHHDGMLYVFTMQLTDSSEFRGGQYIYFRGHRDDFEGLRDEIVPLGADHDRVSCAPFKASGDTMFTRGSRVWHGVTPVISGRRITFAMSMFSPLEPSDENEFWHTAPDDGLLATVRGYLGLAAAKRAPKWYCRNEAIPLDSLTSEAP
ncbi:MAG: hypothetical protein JO287_16255 [Pseudonocardiales bacterium]|nr:hypothetical protein [Pseudonocardiales bacterium]